jgi:hypothetical protein
MNNEQVTEAFPKLKFWESNLGFIGKSGLQTAFSRAYLKTNRVLGKAQQLIISSWEPLESRDGEETLLPCI